MNKALSRLFLSMVSLAFVLNTYSQDKNFHIYLCFGQSNMQGAADIEAQDKTVDSRFKVMQAVDCSNLGRKKGNWYTAVPPLTRCYTGLSPADYFGRTMIENLPDSITIGVINVSVAGCRIELFDKVLYTEFDSTGSGEWFYNIINDYGGNPYGYFMDLAKNAQNDGVIKGILLHQGESNTGDTEWPAKVKRIYDSMMVDLSLNPDSIPLLAGEMVHEEQGGICASMNSIIAKLPENLPNSHVISSKGCTDAEDNLHFDAAGYRKLGTRYAIKMLSFYGIDITEPLDPVEPQPQEPPKPVSLYLEAECGWVGDNWEITNDSMASNNMYVSVLGMESITRANSDSTDIISMQFSLDSADYYNVFARLNCPTGDDDSFWITLDDKYFISVNGLRTNEWQWKKIKQYYMAAGEYTITLTYREDGAQLDKLCITNDDYAPSEIGDTAINVCKADAVATYIDPIGSQKGYILKQNYPNPWYDKTKLSFEIPQACFVSLKVYNVFGVEIKELAGRYFEPGVHTLEFDGHNLAEGQYFYTFRTPQYAISRKMVFLKN